MVLSLAVDELDRDLTANYPFHLDTVQALRDNDPSLGPRHTDWVVVDESSAHFVYLKAVLHDRRCRSFPFLVAVVASESLSQMHRLFQFFLR